jgi:uncharacterized membrane protein (Fun14 family)
MAIAVFRFIRVKIQVIGIACILVFSLAHYQEIWRTGIGVIDEDTIVLDGEKKVRFSNQ